LSEGVSAAVSAVTQTMDLIVKLLDFASNAVYRTIAQSQGARAYFAMWLQQREMSQHRTTTETMRVGVHFPDEDRFFETWETLQENR
jgi:hypothetical protein